MGRAIGHVGRGVSGTITGTTVGRVAGRIIGVDPGSVVTGFGIVEGGVGRPAYLAAGTIRPPAGSRAGARLVVIHERLLAIIDRYAPAAMSLERSFVAANVQSALRLGEARAVAMMAAAERGLGLFEYTPNEVKLTVSGHGHADKAQVKYVVRHALGLDTTLALPDDASDGLAIALCHLFRARVTAVDFAPVERATTSRVDDVARGAMHGMPAGAR